jgi:hypothetical protein
MYAKTLSWGLIISFVFGGWLANPETCASQETRTNPLEGGSLALQFRISENFTLSDFSGSAISLKRHHSARSALRLGMSLGFSSSAIESLHPSFGDTIPSEGDGHSYGFRIDLQYLRYSNPSGRVSPFWGVGPLVGHNSFDFKSSSRAEERRVDEHRWTLGLIGSLGIEWFPIQSIGIHAEYGLSFTYFTAKTREGDPDRLGVTKTHSWDLQGDGVLFGLSVYF